MKTKTVFILLLVTICVLSIGATTRAALAAAPAPSWEQVNVDGFGMPSNSQIQAMETFDGYLYAGVFGWDMSASTPQSQIWRTPDGKQWELVRSTNDAGLRDFIRFNDFLYASTWNGKILRTMDGINWDVVEDDLFTPAYFYGVMRFEVFQGMLYASTQDGAGLEIWRSPDGLNWTKFVDNGLNDPGNSAALGSAVFKGHLYWGTSNYATLASEIWRTDGVTVEEVKFFEFSMIETTNLIVYDNFLYARVIGFPGASSIWRTKDGIDWENVSGMINAMDFGADSLVLYEGNLYLFAQSFSFTEGVLGFEVWSTDNTALWEQISTGGFGDRNNDGVLPNATAVFKGELYAGASNNVTGAEVWRLCTGVCK